MFSWSQELTSNGAVSCFPIGVMVVVLGGGGGGGEGLEIEGDMDEYGQRENAE